jgi:uncharacterized membrane protein YqgA involved in biofilm formation
MTDAPPRRRAWRPWVVAIVVGAVAGAIVLGVGSRLAMRGITLLEDRPREWSVGGTLRVVGFGALFGTIAVLLRAILAVVPSRRLSERARVVVFALLCLALAVLGLTPLTVNRLALFLPVIALYVVALEIGWRSLVRGP